MQISVHQKLPTYKICQFRSDAETDKDSALWNTPISFKKLSNKKSYQHLFKIVSVVE